MSRRLWIALLVAVLALGALACAAAEGANAPKLRTATYLNGGTIPTVSLEYTDPEYRDWIEVYLLKEGEVEPNMGTIERDGKVYSIVGIQTIDPNDPDAYTILEDGATALNTDLYFGDGEPPVEGDEVFLTVGLTGADGEDALGELVPITVPPSGEAFTNAPAAIETAAGE